MTQQLRNFAGTPGRARRGGRRRAFLEALERRELLSAAATLTPDLPGAVGGGAGFAEVVAEHLFYNQSAWDGNAAAANAADDLAVARDKVALTAGRVASFLNYSSYVRGLNGIMVDMIRLAGTPTAADFIFRTGNSNTPGSWTAAPAPASITVRPGAGVAGSDRVTLTWDNDAVRNGWLEVTVKATAATGLAADTVFYFGSAVGDTGDGPGDALVTAGDEAAVQAGRHGPFPAGAIGDPCDVNRDGTVNAADLLAVQGNRTTAATGLRLIDLVASETPPVTLYRREMFAGSPTAVGAVTAGAPGQFDLLEGSGAAAGFAERPGGPALAGEFPPGWSGRVTPADWTERQTIYGAVTVAGTPLAGAGFWGAWVRLASYDTSPAWHPMVMSLNRADGTPVLWVRVYQDGHLWGGYARNGDVVHRAVDLGAVGQDKWAFIGMGYDIRSGTDFDASFFVKSAGTPLQQVGGVFTDAKAWGAFQELRVGSYTAFGEGVTQWTGYLGSVVAGRISSLAELSADPAAMYGNLHITDPDDRPLTWYINPVTGSDSNDGLDPGRAWKTAAKANWELTHMGLFSRGWAGSGEGDALLIDTSAGPLYLSDPLPLMFKGMKLGSATAAKADLRAFKTLSGLTAYDAGAYPHVWKSSDVLPLSVLWENRKWMYHVGIVRWSGTAVWDAAARMLRSDAVMFPGNVNPGSGYNPDAAALYVRVTGGAGITPGLYRVKYTTTDGKGAELDVDIGPNGATATIAAGTIADVAPILEATPGSYWNDGAEGAGGATLYFHPGSNGNPNSDGVVYERSTYGDLSRYNNAAMVLLAAPNTTIQGIKVGGTTTNYPDYGGIQAYVVSDQQSLDGVSAGTLRVLDSEIFYGGYHVLGFTRAPNDTVYLVDNVAAYQASTTSGPTTLVAFGAGNRNTYRWIDVSVPASTGLVGSTAGQAAFGASFIAHGTTENFTLLEFRGCTFDGEVMTLGLPGPMVLADSTFGRVVLSGMVMADRVRTTAGAIGSTGGLIKRNCVERLLQVAAGSPYAPGALGGVQIWSNNVIDASGVEEPYSLRAIYAVTEAAGYSMEFTNNTVLMPPSRNVALFGWMATNAGNYGAFTGNTFDMDPTRWLVLNYDNGTEVRPWTLAEWLALVGG